MIVMKIIFLHVFLSYDSKQTNDNFFKDLFPPWKKSRLHPWMAFRSLTDFLSLVIYQNWSSKSWITEYRRPSTAPCAPLCSSRFISVYEKLRRLNSMSFSQYWYVSLNCQALSLLSSRGDTLKPSKMFLYSFGFECQGCWQIIGCKI